MQITVEIPDEIAKRLDLAWGGLSRRLLEMIVADAYRCGEIIVPSPPPLSHFGRGENNSISPSPNFGRRG
jgi:hypothetical protein